MAATPGSCVLAAAVAVSLACGGLPAGEIPQAALETRHNFGADRWVPSRSQQVGLVRGSSGSPMPSISYSFW